MSSLVDEVMTGDSRLLHQTDPPPLFEVDKHTFSAQI